MNRMVIGYVVGALLSYGCIVPMDFAYFQRKYPSIAQQECRRDLGTAYVRSLLPTMIWPIGLLEVWLSADCGEYGLEWPLLSSCRKEAR